MGRPPNSEGRDTRRDILDAALELFAEQGFSGTSMRQIARAVGVRESALYHHFESKEALFNGLMEAFVPNVGEFFDQLDVNVIAQVGVPVMLRTFAHNILEEWATPRQRKWVRIVMTEGPRLIAARQLDLSTFVERIAGEFAKLFARLMQKGLVREADPAVVAHEWMAGMMMIRLRLIAFTPGAVDMKRVKAMADAHVDFFWTAARPEMKRTFTQRVRP